MTYYDISNPTGPSMDNPPFDVTRIAEDITTTTTNLTSAQSAYISAYAIYLAAYTASDAAALDLYTYLSKLGSGKDLLSEANGTLNTDKDAIDTDTTTLANHAAAEYTTELEYIAFLTSLSTYNTKSSAFATSKSTFDAKKKALDDAIASHDPAAIQIASEEFQAAAYDFQAKSLEFQAATGDLITKASALPSPSPTILADITALTNKLSTYADQMAICQIAHNVLTTYAFYYSLKNSTDALDATKTTLANDAAAAYTTEPEYVAFLTYLSTYNTKSSAVEDALLTFYTKKQAVDDAILGTDLDAIGVAANELVLAANALQTAISDLNAAGTSLHTAAEDLPSPSPTIQSDIVAFSTQLTKYGYQVTLGDTAASTLSKLSYYYSLKKTTYQTAKLAFDTAKTNLQPAATALFTAATAYTTAYARHEIFTTAAAQSNTVAYNSANVLSGTYATLNTDKEALDATKTTLANDAAEEYTTEPEYTEFLASLSTYNTESSDFTTAKSSFDSYKSALDTALLGTDLEAIATAAENLKTAAIALQAAANDLKTATDDLVTKANALPSPSQTILDDISALSSQLSTYEAQITTCQTAYTNFASFTGTQFGQLSLDFKSLSTEGIALQTAYNAYRYLAWQIANATNTKIAAQLTKDEVQIRYDLTLATASELEVAQQALTDATNAVIALQATETATRTALTNALATYETAYGAVPTLVANATQAVIDFYTSWNANITTAQAAAQAAANAYIETQQAADTAALAAQEQIAESVFGIDTSAITSAILDRTSSLGATLLNFDFGQITLPRPGSKLSISDLIRVISQVQILLAQLIRSIADIDTETRILTRFLGWAETSYLEALRGSVDQWSKALHDADVAYNAQVDTTNCENFASLESLYSAYRNSTEAINSIISSIEATAVGAETETTQTLLNTANAFGQEYADAVSAAREDFTVAHNTMDFLGEETPLADLSPPEPIATFYPTVTTDATKANNPNYLYLPPAPKFDLLADPQTIPSIEEATAFSAKVQELMEFVQPFKTELLADLLVAYPPTEVPPFAGFPQDDLHPFFLSSSTPVRDLQLSSEDLSLFTLSLIHI